MALDNYLATISHYAQLHPYMSDLFACLVAFAESLPLIGTIVPGSITMTIMGMLIGRSIIPFSSTLLWATIGALAGDTLGFWVGKHYKERLHGVWPFRKHPKWLTMGESFFQAHGGKSILVGRFVGPARSTVPLIAGLMKMSWPKFLFAATPSAAMWALIYMIPGILVGAISLELPHGKTAEFMLGSLAVIVVLWLIFWMIQHFFSWLTNLANKIIDRTWDWLSRHHSSKFLIRAITNQLNPDDHYQLGLVLMATISGAILILLLVNVLMHSALTNLNQPIFVLLQSIRTTRLDSFFITMTLLGEKSVIWLITLLFAACLLLLKERRGAVHLLILMAITTVALGFFKHAMYSPRPFGFMVIDTSSSFPSGHTTLSVALFGFLAFLSAQRVQAKFQWIGYTLASTLIILVALSRLYLGAHWLTDILGAMALGLALLLLVIVAYRRRIPSPSTPHWKFFICLVGSLIIPWLAFTAINFNLERYQYTPYLPEQQIEKTDWWETPLYYLPVYRLNRLGQPVQPFNVQWSGSLDTIRNTLLQRGWQLLPVMKNNVQNTLTRLTSNNPTQRLPLFSLLYRDKPPVLLLIKPSNLANKAIIELRLWDTGTNFTDAHSPLWIGSVNYHIPAHQIVNLKGSADITLSNGGGLKELTASLSGFDYKVITINNVHKQPRKIHRLEWNGDILIVREPAVKTAERSIPQREQKLLLNTIKTLVAHNQNLVTRFQQVL